MKTSESIDKLAEALSAAQGEIAVAQKDKKGLHGSNYADLPGVWEVIRGPFSKNGIAVFQHPPFFDGRLNLVTRLIHKSGQWMENMISLRPAKDDVHSVCGAITYARRYGLMCAGGIVAAEEDDDGVTAMGTKKEETKAPQKAQPQKQYFSAENPRHVEWLKKKMADSGMTLDVYPWISAKLNGRELEQGVFESVSAELAAEG